MFSLISLLGGDTGIVQTVGNIKSAVFRALRDPNQLIRRRAESLIRNSGARDRDERTEIRTIANFVKKHFHYVHDPRGVEFVKSPELIDQEISRYGQFIGDCDDSAAYLAALLKSIGYRVNLTIISDKRNPRKTFTHIFAQAFSPKMARWVSLDMTAKGKPLGWQAPTARARSYEV